MAYETGIAKTERDFLKKLDTFLTTNESLVKNGQNWTKIFERIIPATTHKVDRYQVVWKATGTGIGQDIYVGAETQNLIADDVYNITFFGGTFFNLELVNQINIEDFKNAMVNVSPSVCVYGNARDFEYHFFANGRHFKVVSRIGKTTSTAYCGFILPTVPPTEYPYPLCIAGTGPTHDSDNHLNRYSREDRLNSSIVYARNKSCYLLLPTQVWSGFYGMGGEYNDPALYPIRSIEDDSTQRWIMQRMVGLGSTPLIPVEFISRGQKAGKNRWGCLDGVYWIPGIQRAAGDVVNINDETSGLVFNDGFRTSTTSYFVFEK